MNIPKWVPLGLCAVLIAPLQANAQQLDPGLVDRMLDCAIHEEVGPWVPKNLRADGLLRFNYLDEPPQSRSGPYEYHDNIHRLYAAFWNASKTEAEFLDFSVRKSGRRNWLTISNDGQISISKGKLNFDFFQGGEWTRDHYMIRVRKLYAAPIQTIEVRNIKRTGVLCDSLAHPHPEWDPKWRGPK